MPGSATLSGTANYTNSRISWAAAKAALAPDMVPPHTFSNASAALTSGMPRPRRDTTALAALRSRFVLPFILATWPGEIDSLLGECFGNFFVPRPVMSLHIILVLSESCSPFCFAMICPLFGVNTNVMWQGGDRLSSSRGARRRGSDSWRRGTGGSFGSPNEPWPRRNQQNRCIWQGSNLKYLWRVTAPHPMPAQSLRSSCR